jgi:hypothetical protein
MIRRILHELNVCALASNVRRRVANGFHANVYVDVQRYRGCAFVGRNPGHGAGYVLDCDLADNWPDHARLLTIGRVTLAAWGGRSS